MNWDVIIIGAGPAGSTAATVLAQAGRRVALLDQGPSPGFHLPETWAGGTCGLLAEIGVKEIADTFDLATTVRLMNSDGSFDIAMRLERVPGASQPAGVRLNRVRFDQLLVEHATVNGAVHYPWHKVSKIGLDTGRPSITYTIRGESGAKLTAELVIDASGKSALLGLTTGLQITSAAQDSRVVAYTHYQFTTTSPFAEPGTMTIVGLTAGYGFVVPISIERASVGVVVGPRRAEATPDPAALFAEMIAESSVLTELTRGAERLLPFTTPKTKYRCSRFAGPGFLIAGDAAAFTDPFFSTGLDIAVLSGVEAGRTAAALLDTTSEPVRAALLDGYSRWLHALLDEADSARYAEPFAGIAGQMLLGLLDPHLPTVLPLAGLLQAAGRSANVSPTKTEKIFRTAREAFSEL